MALVMLVSSDIGGRAVRRAGVGVVFSDWGRDRDLNEPGGIGVAGVGSGETELGEGATKVPCRLGEIDTGIFGLESMGEVAGFWG